MCVCAGVTCSANISRELFPCDKERTEEREIGRDATPDMSDRREQVQEEGELESVLEGLTSLHVRECTEEERGHNSHFHPETSQCVLAETLTTSRIFLMG